MRMIFENDFRVSEQGQEVLGPVGATVAGHPNIFPTAWISNLQICLRIPRSANETEMWWFTFVPREWPAERRAVAISYANHVFGPAGLLEQEDGENWVQSTMQTHGQASRKVPQLLRMNLGHGTVVKEHGLARIDANTSEHPQLWTYVAWQQWMSECDWDELRAATVPPDVM